VDKKIIIIGIAGAIFLIVQYYVVEQLTQNKQEELIDAFFQGHEKGIDEVISLLYNQTENCKPVPISIGNNSKVLFDISCIEKNSQEFGP